ncbi:L-aspartate oxidase [Paenibacillus sp. YPG26]|uniref:L-aspartate oxidase n=1 Tax=Paenibacillus sp. YPG26 TaxID=2878915 RepID=UPI00203A8EF8|nr:L-aspartate oxidase [Paenibacillus sp. YPG26]USB34938.1 L-aspartate oxidase [Paenibacillus sp. YPG26]
MIPKYLVDFDLGEIPVRETEVIVIGTGIAGLFTAIKASEDRRVVLITKNGLMESNTRYAQGGIAAVISEEDSPESHRDDTLFAGADFCLRPAVDVLVHEGSEGVRDLIRMGAAFDQEDGELALTQEAAHSHRRILHANGDATGYEIVRALSQKVRESQNIEILEHHYVIDLITENEECLGALLQGPDGGRYFLRADATVLCSGGAGQLYRYTTNPEVATGDGVAIAYRAGALIRDMEFIQFHPTALSYSGAPRFLISEAVRGEGAVLRNIHGDRFMEKYDPQLELAPRDIVARAIVSEMEATKSTFVYLDITHKSPEMVMNRFPTIYETCIRYGLDITSDWIPVAPAAHYMMGGVMTNLQGETSVARLYACGEVSSTGIHGANRLASNSLTEAIVFGRRIVERIRELVPLKTAGENISYQAQRSGPASFKISERRLKLQKAMVRHAGVRRTEDSLKKVLQELEQQTDIFGFELRRSEELEYANMLTCALLITESALARQESRGGHYREDYPERRDTDWLKRIVHHHQKGMLEAGINDI